MLKTLLASVVIFTAVPGALAASDQATSAEALVSSAASEITKSDRTKIAEAVISHLDVDAIAAFTLGRHGKTLNPTAKARFGAAFETYLRRQIEANADQISGVELQVVNTVNRNDRDAIVTTQVRGAGEPITLRWRVIERGGKWSVVDLEFAGLWLAIEQRAQVSAILDRPGADIEDVIATLG